MMSSIIKSFYVTLGWHRFFSVPLFFVISKPEGGDNMDTDDETDDINNISRGISAGARSD